MKIYKPCYKIVRVNFTKIAICEEFECREERSISLVETDFNEVIKLIEQLYKSVLVKQKRAPLKDRVKITVKELKAPDGKSVTKNQKSEISYSAYGIEVDAIIKLVAEVNKSGK